MNVAQSPSQRALETFSNLLMLTGLFLLLTSVFSLLSWIPLALMYGLSFRPVEMMAFISYDQLVVHPQGRIIILYIQGFTAIGGFIVSSLVFIYLMRRDSWATMNPRPMLSSPAIGICILFTLLIMPTTSLFIEWNANIDFPAWMDGFEKWALAKEKSLEMYTAYFLNFQNTGEFLLGLVVMALIPGIGEELFFRGLLQRVFQKVITVHAAIWITAILFSAIHMQFYGFFPRMLLGCLFGYMYYWSGNLFYPMLAHFINNGATLLMIYVSQNVDLGYDFGTNQAMPWLWVSISLPVSVLLLYSFYRIFRPSPVEGVTEN